MKHHLPEFFIAKTFTTSIVPRVKWNWKRIRAVALLSLLAITAGCSGIHASKSVSPLDFILPGLMKNESPAPLETIPASPPGELLAQAN
jgi:hypothetical protein